MRKRLAARLPSEEPRKRSAENRVLRCHLKKHGETRPEALGIDLAHRHHWIRRAGGQRRLDTRTMPLAKERVVPVGARIIQPAESEPLGIITSE